MLNILILSVALQTCFPCSLTQTLIVNCCIQREADLYYWFPDGDYTPTVESGKARNPINSSKPTTSEIQTERSKWLLFRVEIALDPVNHSVTVIEACLPLIGRRPQRVGK